MSSGWAGSGYLLDNNKVEFIVRSFHDKSSRVSIQALHGFTNLDHFSVTKGRSAPDQTLDSFNFITRKPIELIVARMRLYP